MHPIIENTDRWKAYEAELAESEQRLDRLREQVVGEQAKAATTRAEHEAAIQVALEEGKQIPPSPPVPDFSHLDHALASENARRTAIMNRRSHVLAEIGRGGAIDGCRERLRHQQRAARDALNVVEAARADVDTTLQLLAQLYAAVDADEDRRERPSRSQRVRPGVSLDEFAESIRRGIDLSELSPVLGLETSPTGMITLTAEAYERVRRTPSPEPVAGTLTEQIERADEHKERLVERSRQALQEEQERREQGYFAQIERQRLEGAAADAAKRDHDERVRNGDVRAPEK